jgi:hypothetical protein
MNMAEWKREARPTSEALPEFRPIKFGFARINEWVAECICRRRVSIQFGGLLRAGVCATAIHPGRTPVLGLWLSHWW